VDFGSVGSCPASHTWHLSICSQPQCHQFLHDAHHYHRVGSSTINHCPASLPTSHNNECRLLFFSNLKVVGSTPTSGAVAFCQGGAIHLSTPHSFGGWLRLFSLLDDLSASEADATVCLFGLEHARKPRGSCRGTIQGLHRSWTVRFCLMPLRLTPPRIALLIPKMMSSCIWMPLG
jgi:hypothetical protein